MRPSAHTVVNQADHILLLRRGVTAPWAPGLWGLPGGYIEDGETPAHAAVRELGEEAGIDPLTPSWRGAATASTTPWPGCVPPT